MTFRMATLRWQWRLTLPAMLVIAFAMTACGSDDGSSASSSSDGADTSRFVIESATIFTLDDVKSLGWKEQHDLLLAYPESTSVKWGFLNAKELGILVYPSAAVAQAQGLEAALAQTAVGPDGKAIGDIDRISCRQAQGQSAVSLIEKDYGFDDPYAVRVVFQPNVNGDAAGQRTCANKFPTYRDFRILGNIVLLCEGEGRTGDEESKNCQALPGQLQGKLAIVFTQSGSFEVVESVTITQPVNDDVVIEPNSSVDKTVQVNNTGQNSVDVLVIPDVLQLGGSYPGVTFTPSNTISIPAQTSVDVTFTISAGNGVPTGTGTVSLQVIRP